MTTPTGSSSTTADARLEHGRGLHLADTAADRAAYARSCALCARVWDATDGSFKIDRQVGGERPQPRPVYNPATRQHFTPSTAARATDAQLRFLKTLTTERDLTAVQARVDADRDRAVKGQLSKADASALITLLRDQPKSAATWNKAADPETPAPSADPRPRKAWPKVDEGYYALTIDQLEGTEFKNNTNFFRVDRPTEGRFAGRTFVKLMASDDTHKVYGELARTVLEAIAADPHAAQMLFAKESEHCFRCNRRLTDDESRAAGMGPTCRNR